MFSRQKLISAFMVISAMFAFSLCAQAQTCPGSHLTYIVRDDKGAPIDAEKDVQFNVETGNPQSKWWVSDKQFIKYVSGVPGDINKLNGTVKALMASTMCNFSKPVKLSLTWKDQVMNLTFVVPELSRNDSMDFLVDSVPFKAGDYEIELVSPEGKWLFYPAKGW